MKSSGRTRGFTRALIAALTLTTLVFITPVATAAPANALTNISTTPGGELRCDNSPYYLCLYYNGFDSAWWGTSVAVRDLTGYTFFANTGEGSGQPVKNNAASVFCAAPSTSICYIFSNTGFSGPTDWLYGQRSGRLVETYKADASVHISFGA